jgi:ectoine hydroxylase-related dioxygenase (phytanoyl-CoA dioxygenase family)
MTTPGFRSSRGCSGDDEALPRRGYAVLTGLVPADAVERALRHIHLDLVRRGLPPEALSSWLWSAHWFPHLKWDPPIASLVEHVPAELRDGELCDPQIVVQPPDDGDDLELAPHVDREPDWAGGRPYRVILGVALTPAHRANGGLVVWPLDGGAQTALELEPGDVVVMHPQLPHTSGLNREGAMRYAVDFRFLDG